jgi:hypothetical protein
VLVPLIAGFFLPARRERSLARTPPQWPIYAQAFRTMEIILWLLVQHRVPAIMTSRDATRTSSWAV